MEDYTVEKLVQKITNYHIVRDDNNIYMTISTIAFVYEAIACAGLYHLEIISRYDNCAECHVEEYHKGAFLEILNHTIKFLEATPGWSIASRLPINTFEGLSNQQAALTICKLLSETINRIDGDLFYFFWGMPFCKAHRWHRLVNMDY